MTTDAVIGIHVVTYRRPTMLRRALESVRTQTFRDFNVVVLNDDPADQQPGEIVRQMNDPRFTLHTPLIHRGATRNFNIALRAAAVPYNFVTLLEDDNWWEPEFLQVMMETLQRFPEARVAVANETLWDEQLGGNWVNTGRTIWPTGNTGPHPYSLEEICGSAFLCNSSMLLRVSTVPLETPETIPVDVTEHFRERAISGPVIAVRRPLVNYANTLSTARDSGARWAEYQALLIGSSFKALTHAEDRLHLARRLWAHCGGPTSPRAVSLLKAGLANPEARALLSSAPGGAWVKTILNLARRPRELAGLYRLRKRHAEAFRYLVDGQLTRDLARQFARR